MTAAIQRLDMVLRSAVDSGDVPAVVAVAADDRGVVYEGAAGPRAVGAAEAASADSVFRIASMTKIVTTVAALRLRDEGSLDFAAPVDAYCPDFAAVRVLDGFDGDRPRLRPPASRATVAQLVTHTAGFAYGFWDANLARWASGAKPQNMFDAPMVADPGSRLVYGISTDWLGRVVEAACGKPLDEYLTAHVSGRSACTRPPSAPTTPNARGSCRCTPATNTATGSPPTSTGNARRHGGQVVTVSTRPLGISSCSNGCCSAADRLARCGSSPRRR